MLISLAVLLRLRCIHIALFAGTTSAQTELFKEDKLDPSSLNLWWKPTDFGSPELQFTSTYFDPYKTDTSRFEPFVYGSVSSDPATDSETFEDCMKKCIIDTQCLAFEINMLFVPFQCRVKVDPCPGGLCTAFTPNAHWLHFVKRTVYLSDTTVPQKVKEFPLSDSPQSAELYKFKESGAVPVYFVIQRMLDPAVKWSSIEIAMKSRSPNLTDIPYLWLEYKEKSSSPWLKCHKIPYLPAGEPRYFVPNQCLDYEFPPQYTSTGRSDECGNSWGADSKASCEELQRSWTKSHISSASTKMAKLWLQQDNAKNAQPPGLWYKCCENALVQDPGATSNDPKKLRFIETEDIYAIRFVSMFGKIEGLVEILEVWNFTDAEDINQTTTVTQFGDDDFKFPKLNKPAEPNDPSNDVHQWYVNVTRDGGQLYCHNPIGSAKPVTNVFQRMQHFCYHQGTTLAVKQKRNKTIIEPGVSERRAYRFRSDECTFSDLAEVQQQNCSKSWVDIVENCEAERRCLQSKDIVRNVTFYHQGSDNNTWNNQSADWPVVEWTSNWDRAIEGLASWDLPFSLDFFTEILLILHDCLPNAEFDDEYHGCSQCESAYYEAHYDPSITIDNLRIYEYDRKKQYCRPAPSFFEDRCDQEDQHDPFFCPKGFYWVDHGQNKPKEFKRMQTFRNRTYWTCRTASHKMQQVIDDQRISMKKQLQNDELAQQGFGCYNKTS